MTVVHWLMSLLRGFTALKLEQLKKHKLCMVRLTILTGDGVFWPLQRFFRCHDLLQWFPQSFFIPRHCIGERTFLEYGQRVFFSHLLCSYCSFAKSEINSRGINTFGAQLFAEFTSAAVKRNVIGRLVSWATWAEWADWACEQKRNTIW